MYTKFGINIFEYADAVDFLIAPFQDIRIIMGELSSKVGKGKDETTVGPFGIGLRNERRQAHGMVQGTKVGCHEHMVLKPPKKMLDVEKPWRQN